MEEFIYYFLRYAISGIRNRALYRHEVVIAEQNEIDRAIFRQGTTQTIAELHITGGVCAVEQMGRDWSGHPVLADDQARPLPPTDWSFLGSKRLLETHLSFIWPREALNDRYQCRQFAAERHLYDKART